MKQILTLILAGTPLFIFGADLPYSPKPTEELDLLINSTKRLVTKQETLKSTLEEYLSLEKEALKDPNNRALLQKTAKVAETALDIIKEERLNYLFNPSFISELTLFAKLAKRPSLQPVP